MTQGKLYRIKDLYDNIEYLVEYRGVDEWTNDIHGIYECFHIKSKDRRTNNSILILHERDIQVLEEIKEG